eukprot:TRINITY_DN1666_c0_g1_i2.p4 TRINITY_DN1666_c0_g1~~TRINITY_DN1666_c0_g1_i2.p4  ORF type:complete len:104 (-),score=16.70 TRINITY_DN1666_c0_g1_i2:213-524(-)
MHVDIRHLFHVNLLRYNPAFGIGNDYVKTEEPAIRRFQSMLSQQSIPTSIRQSFGVDIDAACGQLYAKYPPKPARPARTATASEQQPPTQGRASHRPTAETFS